MTLVASVPGCKQTFYINQHEVIEVTEAITETTVLHHQYTQKRINLTGSTAFFFLRVLRTGDDGSQIHLTALSITWNQTLTVNYCKKELLSKILQQSIQPAPKQISSSNIPSRICTRISSCLYRKWIENFDIETLNSNIIC